MTLAILCSGQGRQHPGMFELTGDAPEAADIFAHAATLLGGRDPRQIVRTDTSESLHHNRVGQILCSLQALAAVAALRDSLPNQVILAGYSVGELAAWGVAGLFSLTDTLDLVASRAEVMDAASPPGDGLLFVRGLSREAIDDLCQRHETAIAIVNPGDAFILGGNRTTLRAFADEARALKATRVVDVPVEVASHTNRLSKASIAFRETLRHVHLLPVHSSTRLLSGVDGSPVASVEEGLEKLAAQISHTVQWADCLQGCIEGGATVFLELGPGRALSEMVAGTYSGVPTRSVEDFRTLQGARKWIRNQANF